MKNNMISKIKTPLTGHLWDYSKNSSSRHIAEQIYFDTLTRFMCDTQSLKQPIPLMPQLTA